jgi:hypothetical protein
MFENSRFRAECGAEWMMATRGGALGGGQHIVWLRAVVAELMVGRI